MAEHTPRELNTERGMERERELSGNIQREKVRRELNNHKLMSEEVTMSKLRAHTEMDGKISVCFSVEI